MQIVVTGASGPLGQSLLRGLVAKGSLSEADGPVPIRRILAVDREQGPALFLDDRIEYVRGAFEQPRFLARMMGTATDGIFHLAALDPGPEEGENPAVDLESDLTRTWDGTRALLDACGFQSTLPKVVIASTIEAAAEGGCEASRSRAGALAAMCELLIAEGARRRIVRSRCIRLAALGNGSTLEEAVAGLISAYETMR